MTVALVFIDTIILAGASLRQIQRTCSPPQMVQTHSRQQMMNGNGSTKHWPVIPNLVREWGGYCGRPLSWYDIVPLSVIMHVL